MEYQEKQNIEGKVEKENDATSLEEKKKQQEQQQQQ